ncbi:MAG: YggS family pyridoxal phosphate-dependent enzyme [Chlorobi bacterium]|nr:YggS family pyridoxal phosphate-dependent enzyme [Chlorobiota bacterium]
MSVAENIKKIKKSIPEKVKLIAVSKTKPNSLILEAYDIGQRIFGENKIQDLVQKYEELPKDIQWHMIGHLQTNKVKYIAPFISLIHSVDSLKLLKLINKEATKHHRTIDCLIQMHIAEEETKFGCNLIEAREIINAYFNENLENVRIVGVMGMATYTTDEEQIRKEFKQLKNVFNTLRKEFFIQHLFFSEISMGMSSDYLIAIEEGSTMIRVGSSIFGARY